MWNAYVWALLASYQLYDILLFLISGILCHGWMVDHTKFPCIHWNVHFHLPLFIWHVDNMTFCVLKDHMYWFSFALQMAIYALGFKLLYCWGRVDACLHERYAVGLVLPVCLLPAFSIRLTSFMEEAGKHSIL